MDFEIKKATQDHCLSIAQIHVLSWQHAYCDLLPSDYLAQLSVEKRAETWRNALKTSSSQVLVAQSGDGLLGFISFAPCRDEDAASDQAEIWSLYVSPAYWAAGVGLALYTAAKERIQDQGFKALSLWVLAGNQRALQFYAKAGFAPDLSKTFELAGVELQELRLVQGLT
ncbi:GNAT family N-acetyltransferase [Iodobacter fluviatilis]|uniref:Acetyltransferase (GNAT) family protein n=1 Tax=Iodobacter fluviatilis TaxID=537 RepID=A0A377Q3J4_9NEIS|nr:GNAT family N-acetyltransferase [Iodobacter fluviatilis]TCU90112.1 acetyltransferase (GNAT) family protein [Iodobacter fluviatilis]STQ89139.1 Predicted acetyltransferase [Iodobacter fluviatilis]